MVQADNVETKHARQSSQPLSDFYDRYWEHDIPEHDPTTPKRKLYLARELAQLEKSARVLDLGCGSGGFSDFIASLELEVVGVDVSAVAVERATSRYPSLRFEELAQDLSVPAEDCSFDAVWTSEVIEHVLEVHKFLAEANRVLRLGGRLILTTPYHGVVKNVLLALTKFHRHFDPELSHIRFFDKRGLDRCLKHAGFSPMRWKGIGRVFPLYRTWFVVAQKTGVPSEPVFRG